MLVDYNEYLVFTCILFLIGVCGIALNRKNILIMLMSVELLLLSINLNFVLFALLIDDILGEIFSFFILTVAAAESAIGLAILVIYYRIRGSVSVEFISLLRG